MDKSAFAWCSSLEEIYLPDGITAVESSVFSNCGSLKKVVLPESVKVIEEDAFGNCTRLTELNIPYGIEEIKSRALYGCESLKLTKHGNAYYLGGARNPYAVLYKAADKDVTEATVNADTRIIYDGAFKSCLNLSSVRLNNNLLSKGDSAFFGSGLEMIEIPDSVKRVGTAAFSQCAKLASAICGKNMTEISMEAFSGCVELTEISLPEGLTAIGYKAFASCVKLTEFTVPDGVTNLDSPFADCSGLKRITLSAGINTLGWATFENCSSLCEIIFKGTVKEWGEVYKGYGWDVGTGEYIITCSDGNIVK